MRHGGIGLIEEGLLKGRKFIIPSEVYVEKSGLPGGNNFSKACLIHQKFIADQGCEECRTELEAKQKEAEAIGL